MQPFITAKQAEIVELCRTHYVRRFSVFGSAVRDDVDPATSDVDVRVEFDREKIAITPPIWTTCMTNSPNSSDARLTS